MRSDEFESERSEFSELVATIRGAGLNIPGEVRDIAGLIIAVKASPTIDNSPDNERDELDQGFATDDSGQTVRMSHNGDKPSPAALGIRRYMDRRANVDRSHDARKARAKSFDAMLGRSKPD
jgi:hypothetical protein